MGKQLAKNGALIIKKLKVLISAYACEPGKGSEPGVGWNIAVEIARYHDVWVLTRANNRSLISNTIDQQSIKNLHFVYYDLPFWARFWKRGSQGIQLYYYLWQIGIYNISQSLHKQIGFDLAHHITFGRYWSPSLLSLLPIPFIWGPVGGGEAAPKTFWSGFSWRGRIYEFARSIGQTLGELDPLVRLTVKNSKLVLITTPDTSHRLSNLGAKRIEILPGQTGINQKDFELLSSMPSPKDEPLRFVSICRLIHWKGIHLALEAFALTYLPKTEYWIIGDGPEKKALEQMTRNLGIAGKVQFLGNLAREATLVKLGECHALIHPSLHDFSPTVCLEGMAAGKPVICLDIGGPAIQITEETGIKISASNSEQVIRDMANAMVELSKSRKSREAMGKAGRARVSAEYSWSHKAALINDLYLSLSRNRIQAPD